MAYNKDNYENNRLTPKQEEFVFAIAEGKSQYEAYIHAYPTAKKWKRGSVDVKANELMKNVKIVLRLEELRKIKEQKIIWTRERALNEINFVLDMNKKDIERMNEAYDLEIQILEGKLAQLLEAGKQPEVDVQMLLSSINNINREIVTLKQRRRVSSVNSNGILNAAKVLNRMYGFDITKVEINTETNETEENLRQLSVEELKAIAYANRSDGAISE